MEFYETLRARRSIRSYKTDPVERSTIDRILEAGRIAPSWCNRQCWRYILISDPETRAMLGELIDNPNKECYVNAPYALVLCADPSDSGVKNGKEYYLVDCGISMQQVVLAATAEGLGTCWVGAFSEYPIRNLLGIPQDVKIVAITPIGYADETPGEQERLSLNKIVFEGNWRRDNT